MKKRCLFFIGLLLSGTGWSQNADSTWFVNNYQKKEVYISMRDGIRLFTAIYIPTDKSRKHPFLMSRTPYSCYPYGKDKFTNIWNRYRMAYARENYILVFQDVRGRYMSEGAFEDVRPFIPNKKTKKDIDEASDTYDTIDWLVKNIENNNERAGVMGISYPGFYSTEAALCNHPALKAVSPQAPVTNWFIGDDFHHNGAFFVMDGFSFYSEFGKPHPRPTMDYGDGFSTPVKDNYKFFLEAGTLKNLGDLIGDSIRFWHEMYKHPNYDDWWKARDARAGLFNVKPAMLWVGGLFDAEDCWGAWNSYKACEKQSPNTKSSIVMGPWSHGQWSWEGNYLGNIRFGSNTAAWYQQNIEVPFFQYYLEGKGSIADLAEATIYFTGENQWKKLTQWPPANMQYQRLVMDDQKKLHFSENREATPTLPAKSSGSYFEYISDPQHPVPYTEDVHEHRTTEYMNDDQRFASRRPDVLSFQMEELNEDITVAGPLIADIVTSISGTDADFVVKLIDVFPDGFAYPPGTLGNNKDYPMGGYQMLVRAEIMRGKYREDLSHPKPFQPGMPTHVKFELPDLAHTFKKGHRIMIQVQSSWFPLADRNPQVFTDIYQARSDLFQKQTIQLFYGDSQTSFYLPLIKNK